jgi:hypothetical protein
MAHTDVRTVSIFPVRVSFEMRRVDAHLGRVRSPCETPVVPVANEIRVDRRETDGQQMIAIM